MTDHPARTAVVAHHAEMVAALRSRVEELVGVVAADDPSTLSAAAVADYITSTIVPHAAAEEAVLYPAAAVAEPRLVESLLLEHGLLRSLAARLAAAGDGARRLAAASAFLELFALHAAKENDLVLPTILATPGSDLGALLEGMHAHLEQPAHATAPVPAAAGASR